MYDKDLGAAAFDVSEFPNVSITSNFDASTPTIREAFYSNGFADLL